MHDQTPTDIPTDVPTDILVRLWGLDAAALIEALRPRVGRARIFFAGALADDLGTNTGPAEITALTGDAGHAANVAELTFEPNELISCPVPVVVTAVSADVLSEWSVPLASLLIGPAPVLREMPAHVATAFHAFYTQRELLPEDDYLAAELELAHAEALPLYVATREVYELHRRLQTGAPLSPARELIIKVRMLLGVLGYCNPNPSTLLPLFERAVCRLGLSPEPVRRAMVSLDAQDCRAAVRALEQFFFADPVLRFCEGLAWKAAAEAVLT